jgi:hypothetical protein
MRDGVPTFRGQRQAYSAPEQGEQFFERIMFFDMARHRKLSLQVYIKQDS